MKYFLTEQQRKATHSTEYLEFIKGEYNNECWLEHSITLHDDIFNQLRLYDIFKSVLTDFDYYGITEVYAEQWFEIKKLAQNYSEEIQNLITELDEWATDCFSEYKVFTILGI